MTEVKIDGSLLRTIGHVAFNQYIFVLCFAAIRYFFLEIWPFEYLTLKIQGQHGQGHSQGQNWQPDLRPSIKSLCSFLILRQPEHFFLTNSKFNIWPWKFKVKVMAKVKMKATLQMDYITLYYIYYIQWIYCYLFHGNQAIFSGNIASSIFDHEILR